jgi:hypothetical protein
MRVLQKWLVKPTCKRQPEPSVFLILLKMGCQTLPLLAARKWAATMALKGQSSAPGCSSFTMPMYRMASTAS